MSTRFPVAIFGSLAFVALASSIQAELAAAAPALVKAAIVARNNAAVAEAVKKTFEANGYGGAQFFRSPAER